jgi:hypothetical protein
MGFTNLQRRRPDVDQPGQANCRDLELEDLRRGELRLVESERWRATHIASDLPDVTRRSLPSPTWKTCLPEATSLAHLTVLKLAPPDMVRVAARTGTTRSGFA